MHHFRRKYKYFGHFWQDRYKSLLIEKDSYLLVCGKYVELNPVRAKIVETPDKYSWNSYGVYTGKKTDDLITFDPIYETLGKTQKERAEEYERLTCENLNLNRRYIGSEAFI
jgi:putative transposase